LFVGQIVQESLTLSNFLVTVNLLSYIVMFKALIKSAILFILLFFNMAIFTWCLNQLLGQTPLKKTLISNVQAEAPHKAVPESVPKVITQRPIRPTRHTAPSPHRGKPKQRLVLQFRSIRIHLDTVERVKLEKMLLRLNITPSHSAQIFSGAVHSKNNLLSPQRAAKLRAQNVARIIYPYTQSLKMYYRPSMEEGKVIVEIFEPTAAGK